jgi:hypothetical protein
LYNESKGFLGAKLEKTEDYLKDKYDEVKNTAEKTAA